MNNNLIREALKVLNLQKLYLHAMLMFGICLFAISSSNAQSGTQELQRCAADDFLQEALEANPGLFEHLQEMESLLQENIRSGSWAEKRSSIAIPVVFHVVWNRSEENISDLQIFDQLEILNRSFNMNNRNLHTVPSQFRNLIANIDIEFCLAARDPDGNPTTGITRTFTPIENVGSERIDFLRRAIHFSEAGGVDHWDPDRYLNVWVCRIGGGLIGNATFPNAMPYPEAEGVVIDYRYVGSIGTAVESRPYDGGKTLIHEIGHYFNLFHPWGPGSGSCDVDDFVEDTPLQIGPYFSCDESDRFSCGSEDIVTNFMDYPEDDCLAMFTHGQRERMLSSLISFRQPLLESDACLPPMGHEPSVGQDSDLQFSYLFNAGKIALFSNDLGPFSGNLYVYDIAGRLIFEESIAFDRIHLVNADFLLPGVYITCFNKTNNRYCGKILIGK
ncbi:MAG: zinc metalloprotease [Saprospirales bacterium]|nr:MAG: zinc metalloprotease [Saprospirales bacterium]